jgi:hypothetical protein
MISKADLYYAARLDEDRNERDALRRIVQRELHQPLCVSGVYAHLAMLVRSTDTRAPVDANYLLKAAQAFTLSVGAPPYAIGIQVRHSSAHVHQITNVPT